ncbi:MAG: hypothetical protein Unbinned6284contig1001_59 [Prokaryotic dsDNA virus sp.]|nr:MAG: hypothetical protein Unbinned6284contig1001_59 [Prokaryotic dsDNA virus sp.]|tara:strand:+ start:858 stop:1169 length:312 start_codon:yes stop_codon:yes gene_type:complete
MNTKFTPGPWGMAESKNTLGDFVCNIHQSDGAEYTPHYSDVATTITGEKESIQKANAHLIACAPDMYEMLKLAMSLMDGDSIEDFAYQYQEIKSILNQVEGEQ